MSDDLRDDLRDDLTSIDGVGDATADKILGVLDDHNIGEHPYVEKARAAAERGDYREAGIFIVRSGGE